MPILLNMDEFTERYDTELENEYGIAGSFSIKIKYPPHLVSTAGIEIKTKRRVRSEFGLSDGQPQIDINKQL